MDEPLRTWEGRTVAELAKTWGTPRLLVLGRTGSTNTVLRQLAAEGWPAGSIVMADEQTAGRGRLGRAWLAPAGAALLFSRLFRMSRDAPAPGAAPIRAGLAVASAIGDTTGLRARLKWPNDVLLGTHKVAGILCEAATAGNATHLVAGIGINVNQREADFEDVLRANATSLRIETGRAVDRVELAGALARALGRVHSRIGEPLDDTELDAYATLDALCGRTIVVDDRPGGTASGISPDGALIVDGAAGRTAVVAATVRLATDPVEKARPTRPTPQHETRSRC